MIIRRLIEIDRPSLHPRLAQLHAVRFIESYKKITGMALRAKSLEDLMDAKPDSAVRAYGQRFLEIANANGEGTDSAKVAALIREALETQRVARLFSGRLDWAARISRAFHLLIPSILATAGKYAADNIARRAEWFEFSGGVDRAIDRASLLRTLDILAEKQELD